jgi:DNA-binding transcriptional LysR family regulator
MRANASFGVLHMARLLPAYCARYPEVQLEVLATDRMANLVEEGVALAVPTGWSNIGSRARCLFPKQRQPSVLDGNFAGYALLESLFSFGSIQLTPP